jgi:gas vesicle protein
MFGLTWNGWRLAALFGVGVIVGAVGHAALSGRPSRIKEGAATILSHGLAAKRKAKSLVETAKENIEDLVTEADQKLQDRTNAAAEGLK